VQLGKLIGAAFWTLLAQAGELLPSHRNADPFLLLCTTGHDSELHCCFSLSFWMMMTVNATQKTQALLRSSAPTSVIRRFDPALIGFQHSTLTPHMMNIPAIVQGVRRCWP
jgi:hypothetical protein